MGASEKTHFNTYTYVFYFIVEESKILTLTAEYNPLDQDINILSEPAHIELQDGFYPIKTDKKLSVVRNWLKENNPDLSSSVLVSSMAKKFYFGTLYKVVFKVTSKYIIYVAYVECGTKDVKIYDTQEVDHFNANPEIVDESDDLTAGEGEGEVHIMPHTEGEGEVHIMPHQEGEGEVHIMPHTEGEGEVHIMPHTGEGEGPVHAEGGEGHFAGEGFGEGSLGGDVGSVHYSEGGNVPEAKLKGFARPNASSN